MKLKPYIERLEKSKEYKDFKSRYPESFIIAGFFVLDFEDGMNIHQIDFYVPSEKKIAAFSLDKEIKYQLLKTINRTVPEKLDLDVNIDLDALPGILKEEMRNRNISEDIRKIIAIVQNVEGKKIWNLNCVLTGMEILKSHIEDETKTVLKMEKESFLDIMKKLPINKMQIVPKELKKSEELEEQMDKLSDLEKKIKEKKRSLEQKIKKEKITKKRSASQ